MAIRIGADTGGTHTDLAVVDDDTGAITTLKVPTTPDDLSRGIAAGMLEAAKRAGRQPSEVSRFVYGTTLVTNLIVEEKQLPIGLIATGGFRDVLEIGRASRKPNVYDIHWRPPAPLIRRELRLTVTERIGHDGSIIVPLDEADVERVLDQLAAAGVESVAVCLLHSYANPVHERRIGEIAAKRHPAIDISLSCDVAREFREYERSSTTAVNAFVISPISRHLDELGAALAEQGVQPKPYIMRGNGGVMSFASAKQLPAAITHSGPMGGIIGGALMAERCGLTDVITLDMGGTSADVSLIAGGKPTMTTRSSVGRHPLLLPMLDMVTIGAGGGSIAWVDVGGALRVGPRSAGSVPGPACYGQGGADPTVTDANLIAGRLNADYFLAGARTLYPDAALAALQARVCEPCGLSVTDAALGIMAIAEAHMVNAIKLISVQRGLDPRNFTLVGFGGAGPLHTVRLAEELGATSVLIPPAPGNVSALGMLAADVRHDIVRTRIALLSEVDPSKLAADFADMLEVGTKALRQEGVDAEAEQFVMSIDLRYRGQNYELNLPVGSGDLAAALARLPALFHAQHRTVFGYEMPDKPIQMVNLRLAAIGKVAALPWPRIAAGSGAAPAAGRRRVMIDRGQTKDVNVYRLSDLRAGQTIDDTAIVEYPGSTLFIPPGWSAACNEFQILHLQRQS